MTTLEQCKRILNRKTKKYNDEEVRQIRDYLYFIGLLDLENNSNNKELTSDERNFILPC